MKRALRTTEILLHVILIAIMLGQGIVLLKSGMYFPASIILGLSITATLITVYWKKFKLLPRQARQASYYLEGIVFLISYVTFRLQNEYQLAKILLIAAIVFPFFGFASSLKTYKRKRAL